MMKIDKPLTITQVADLTGYSRNYLYYLTAMKRIPFYHYGRKLLFDADQIETWMNNRLTFNDIHRHETK